MHASGFIEKIRHLAGNVTQLGRLQFELYRNELANARRNLILIIALMMVAAALLLAGVALSLVAVVLLLVESGYSTGTAISLTAAATFSLFILSCGCAVIIAKNQMRKFTVPNAELRANFACIRDQVITNS